MPTKKTKQMKRKPRRQSGKTDKGSITTESRIVRSVRTTGAAFPPHLRRTLRYVETQSLTSTSGSVANYQWRVNDCFDPNLTGAGHQPRYYDQLCSSTGPYQKYRVLGGRITLEFHSDNGTDNTIMAAGFSDLPALPSDYTAGELPGWRTIMVPKVFARPESVMFAYRMADIESVSESAILSEDNYSALYNATPADPGYFSVILQCVSGGTTTAYFLITMELDVQFEQPILIAQS